MSRAGLRWVIHRFPVEVSLIVFLVVAFVIQLIDNPGFWYPAKFVKAGMISSDVLTCPRHDTKDTTIFCDLESDKLLTSFPISTTFNRSMLDSYPTMFGIQEGGYYAPTTCTAQVMVNIIIPYRNRPHQLDLFMQHIHPFLVGQDIEYRLFVIEQADSAPFNRGKLFNIGFMESIKISPKSCCFILHDVDLLPENQVNLYACSKSGPRHMSVAVNTFRYNLIYPTLFGGVSAVKKRDMKQSNGFSNLYYGWGGEDDDWSSRLEKNGLTIVRWDPMVSRYFMLSHRKELPSGANRDLKPIPSETQVKWENDGLSSLSYRVLDVTNHALYTKIRVTL